MADPFTPRKLKWLSAVCRDHEVPALGCRVAVLIADYLNRQRGEAWPSQDTLADACGVDPRSIRSAIKDLSEAGHLQISRSDRTASNRYVPLLDGSPIVPDERKQASGRLTPDERKNISGRTQRDRKPASAVTGSLFPPNLLNEPIEEESPSSDCSLFERAWSAFPAKGRERSSRKLARAQWERAARAAGDDPPSEPEPDPVDVAFRSWNILAERYGLPLAERLTETRRKHLAKRLDGGDLDRWRRALEAVERSRFLRGMAPPRKPGDRPFKAHLDFVLQASSFQKLIEGHYGDDAKPLGPVEPPVAPVSPWVARCRDFKRNHYWNTTDWGEKPGRAGCEVPAEILAEFGLPATPEPDPHEWRALRQAGGR